MAARDVSSQLGLFIGKTLSAHKSEYVYMRVSSGERHTFYNWPYTILEGTLHTARPKYKIESQIRQGLCYSSVQLV